MEVYEVWNFKEESNNLFKDQVKGFMKMKLETSPWESDFELFKDYRFRPRKYCAKAG